MVAEEETGDLGCLYHAGMYGACKTITLMSTMTIKEQFSNLILYEIVKKLEFDESTHFGNILLT